jgi:hypothetical protein
MIDAFYGRVRRHPALGPARADATSHAALDRLLREALDKGATPADEKIVAL